MRLIALAALLAGCASAPVPVNSSPYACPDGRQARAGLSADRRHLRLLLDGRAHTLERRDDGSYGNGYYSVRLDDLFLHLARPGALLPQHCRLLVPAQ